MIFMSVYLTIQTIQPFNALIEHINRALIEGSVLSNPEWNADCES